MAVYSPTTNLRLPSRFWVSMCAPYLVVLETDIVDHVNSGPACAGGERDGGDRWSLAWVWVRRGAWKRRVRR